MDASWDVATVTEEKKLFRPSELLITFAALSSYFDPFPTFTTVIVIRLQSAIVTLC